MIITLSKNKTKT